MPVAHLYVVGLGPEEVRRLGEEATDIYADALTCPIERVRVYVVNHAPENVWVAGVNCGEGGAPMPFFTARFRTARPHSQRKAVLHRFAELLAEVCRVDISGVRGQVIPVDSENWLTAKNWG